MKGEDCIYNVWGENKMNNVFFPSEVLIYKIRDTVESGFDSEGVV